ncbi:hypothetical protein ABVT39_012334 [Epinephelus coioides]
MKDNTPEERDAEVKRAKQSQKEWTRVGRHWEYQELCSVVPDEASRQALVDLLRSKGFFVVGEAVQDLQGAEMRSCKKIAGEEGPNPPSVTAEDKSSAPVKSRFDDQWDAFITEFPITVGALPPSKDDIVEAGFGGQRMYYYKWRRMQLETRVLHVSAGDAYVQKHLYKNTTTYSRLDIKGQEVTMQACITSGGAAPVMIKISFDGHQQLWKAAAIGYTCGTALAC